MSYLYINTAFSHMEISVFSENSVVFFKRWEPVNYMMGFLHHMEKIDFHSLSGLLVNIGPGRFGSLRMGLSFVNTISYTHNIPIYPYKSIQYFHALKKRFSLDDSLCFLQQTGVADVFVNGVLQSFNDVSEKKCSWYGDIRTPEKLPSRWSYKDIKPLRDKEFFVILLQSLEVQKNISLEYGRNPSIHIK
jgi:hypothetical protein